ncbi:MAG: hypothetical protein GY754_35585 [bacterium]|nr:hypothetical protein [bacterium]
MKKRIKRKKRKMLIIILLALTPLYHSIAQTSGDYIIPGMDPPPVYWKVPGGSCGEASLWPIFKAAGKNISQAAINRAGGNTGSGLYARELFVAMKKYKIPHRNISKQISGARAKSYRRYLYKGLIERIKKGKPILLGVKIYPDEHPGWACDHFILLVGYNSRTKEIIYNSNAARERISAEKLLNTKPDYSIVSKRHYVFAIEF